MENPDAQRRIAIQHRLADAWLTPSAHEDEIAATQTWLHARALLDDRVPRRSAELGRCEEYPRGTAEHDAGDHRGNGDEDLLHASEVTGSAAVSPVARLLPTATTESSSAERTATSGPKSHETFVPPVTVQSVYVELVWTTLALTVVADALSVKATLSMFAGLVALSEYATAETV